jgi:YihY family inner membrane protein
MTSTAPSEWREASRSREGEQSGVRARLGALGTDARGAMTWWQKVNNDWVFNLSAMLAYNFLMSVFPILLVLLAVAGFIIGNLAPAQQASFQASLNNAMPGGKTIVTAVTGQLHRSAGLLLVIGIVVAAFTGSRLFIVLENCFGIIFRLRSRDVIHQNIMALGMFVLYLVLVPLVVLGSVVPSAILNLIGPAAQTPVGDFFTQLIGILTSVVFACILVGAIYVVVPNRPVQLREVWKGTLVAAALLVLYNLLFPFYESYFLHPNNYGSLAGFAVVILVFMYYLGFIILIGAEVNSWASGQRQTAADVPSMMHEVQAHDTTRGAAGPTAGERREDLQHGAGAAAMQDTDHVLQHEREQHHTDLRPPKPAEAHLPGPPERTQQRREQRWDEAAHETGVEGDARDPQQPTSVV